MIYPWVISWAPAYEGERDELFICSDCDSFKSAPVQHRTYKMKHVEGYSGIMGLDYLNDVAKSILHQKEAPITGAEGADVLKVVEAFYSSVEQKTEVRL